MSDFQDILNGIDSRGFEQVALESFTYQYSNVPIYRAFCDLLGRQNPKSLSDIPFLPIEFFKSHQVLAEGLSTEQVFLSSGTGGDRSKHLVHDLDIYLDSFQKAFELSYGDVGNYQIISLLPSYQENGDSSLIYMVDKLMAQSKKDSKYIRVDQESADYLHKLSSSGQVILIGVTYALLNLARQFPMNLNESIVMETGGMKGMGKELVRAAVHEELKSAFSLSQIHSEYGMTELLSQAYSKRDGIFNTPPWMKVLIRSNTNPLEHIGTNRAGGIDVIDLANKHSCSFISTKDLGKQFSDASFEVLGRMDQSEIRGCNLLSF